MKDSFVKNERDYLIHSRVQNSLFKSDPGSAAGEEEQI